jgi:hypothetical protein
MQLKTLPFPVLNIQIFMKELIVIKLYFDKFYIWSDSYS